MDTGNLFNIAGMTGGIGGGGERAPVVVHEDLTKPQLVGFWNYSLYFSAGLFGAFLMGNVPVFFYIKIFMYFCWVFYCMLYKNANITVNWQPRVTLSVCGIAAFEFLLFILDAI